MGKIDTDTEAAQIYTVMTRTRRKAGLGPRNWRPAVNEQEKETAWQVERYVSRTVAGYEGAAAGPAHARSCRRCGATDRALVNVGAFYLADGTRVDKWQCDAAEGCSHA